MTTQATHTPGPWREKRKLAIYSADDEPICTVFPAETEGQSAADARLIAAAPDLLESLRDLAQVLEDQSGDLSDAAIAYVPELNAALSAIAKAEGRAGE